MPVPGVRPAKRVLNVYYLLDTSGSMAEDGKIAALNQAVRQTIPKLKQVESLHPGIEINILVTKFSTTASWHINPGIRLSDLNWRDLEAGGATAMGSAIALVVEDLNTGLPKRALPPLLVLVTDGSPTDDFDGAIAELRDSAWGQKSVRIAIGVGPKEVVLWDKLQLFMFGMKPKPLHATNAVELVEYIKWASTTGANYATTVAKSGEGETGQDDWMPSLPLIEFEKSDIWA